MQIYNIATERKISLYTIFVFFCLDTGTEALRERS